MHNLEVDNFIKRINIRDVYKRQALYVVAHKLLNLFYGAVVLARLFPYGEKLSWRTRRLARYLSLIHI